MRRETRKIGSVKQFVSRNCYCGSRDCWCYDAREVAQLTAISITPPSPAIVAGQTQQFTATGIYNNGGYADLTASATWDTSDASIATIDAAGLLAAVNDGLVTVTAASGSTVGSTNVMVEEFALVSINVYPAALTLQANQTQQFGAGGTYSDDSESTVTAAVTWSSSDPDIATVDSSGFATARAPGSVQIRAVSGDLISAADLTVTGAAQAPTPIPAPCALLQKALAQKALLMTGMGAIVIDTPQLGRVEYNRTNIGDLEMWIQQLASQCAACGGPLPPGYSYQRRRPLSMEACP